MLAMVRGLAEMTHMKEEIASCFKTKDLGKVHHFCRFEITWDRSACTITLAQSHYSRIILEQFGLENAHPSSTPMAVNVQLKKLKTPTVNIHQYQSMLGLLMYASIGTCPDLFCSQHTCPACIGPW